MCERKNSANIKVCEEEGEEGTSGAWAEISLQPMVKTIVIQIVSRQPMEDSAPEQVDREGVILWRAHSGVRSCQKLQPMGRSSCWSRFSGRTCDPAGVPHWISPFLKDCTPQKGPTMEQFMKNCSPWEEQHWTSVWSSLLWAGSYTGPGEEYGQWSGLRQNRMQEGAAETA